MGIAVQKIRREEEVQMDMAIKYYSIISILNGLKLPKREVELLAFTAIRGTITPLPARQDFVEIFDSSLNSIENMKGRLYRKGLMVKSKEMYRVNPIILPDFLQERLVMQIDISVKKKNKEEEDGERTKGESE